VLACDVADPRCCPYRSWRSRCPLTIVADIASGLNAAGQAIGNGLTPTMVSIHPGCCNAAPRRPQAVRRTLFKCAGRPTGRTASWCRASLPIGADRRRDHCRGRARRFRLRRAAVCDPPLSPSARVLAFDLLHLDGIDLRRRPLVERRAKLASLIEPGCFEIRLSEHLEGDGAEFFAAAVKHGLEGIISKLAGSVSTVAAQQAIADLETRCATSIQILDKSSIAICGSLHSDSNATHSGRQFQADLGPS
jgi:hypothetical protein